jgi:Zn finger protein HypA/HybF involved in hydrogenase expression
MGSQITATCRCGLEVNVLIGGGFEDFTKNCYFPCLCEACHNIVEVNILAKTKRCPKCKSPALIAYDDPRLSKTPGKRTVAEWCIQELDRDLILTNGNYMCPKCKKLSLRFRNTGLCWN